MPIRRPTTWLALCLAAPLCWAAGSTPVSLCVWDPLGNSGPLTEGAKDYALAMQKHGVDLGIKSYTDEHVASEEFRVGVCDGLMATSLRTKLYNPVTAAMDYGGAATIVRDGVVDMASSYQVIQKALQIFASAAGAKLNVQDRFEVVGIVPFGPIYTWARDRTVFKRGFAGTRMAAFDHDKTQAYVIAAIGAQPVSADTHNFATKFNNGGLDVIFAPAVAYKPLEFAKGMGTQGGVSHLPLAFSTMQIVVTRGKFPEGFGQQSRQYWLDHYEPIMNSVRKAEADVPAALWVDYPPQEAAAFVAGQRDMRIELANKGFYNKQGLKLMKRVRCSVYSAAAECGNQAEIDW
jgi:hypothetical protein